MKTFIRIVLLTFLMLCLTPFSGSTQQSQVIRDVYPVRLGIKGGVNFSTLYIKGADKTKALTGFNIGVFGKLPVAGGVSVQPELYYIAKGADVTYNNTFASGTVRYSLNYVELPLLLMVNINPNFNVHAGPYAAVLINGSVKHLSDVSLFDFEQNLNTKNYNRLDTGLAFGAGIDIASISIGLRYSFGVSTVGKERTFMENTYKFPNGKNGLFNLYLSLSLN